MKVSVSKITKNGLRTIQDIRDAGIKVIEIIPADVENGKKHDICIGVISAGGIDLSIRLGKSLLANLEPDKAEYIINSIVEVDEDGKKEFLWSFRQEADGLKGVARLYDLENYGWVIALVGRFKEQVNKSWGITKVIPLDALLGNIYNPTELTRLKIYLAKALDEHYVLSDEEWGLRKKYLKEKDISKTQRRKEWIDRQQQVRARRKIQVFNVDGLRLYGIPVTDDDLEYLPDSTPVIIVSSYDDETGDVGELLEACFIKQARSGPRKVGSKIGLTWDEPEEEIAPFVEAEPISLVVDGKEGSFTLFSKAGMDSFYRNNFSMKATVAIDEPDDEGRYPLIRITRKKSRVLGYFPRA